MEAYFQRVVASRRFLKRSERFFETPYRSKENSRARRAGSAHVAPGVEVWWQGGSERQASLAKRPRIFAKEALLATLRGVWERPETAQWLHCLDLVDLQQKRIHSHVPEGAAGFESANQTDVDLHTPFDMVDCPPKSPTCSGLPRLLEIDPRQKHRKSTGRRRERRLFEVRLVQGANTNHFVLERLVMIEEVAIGYRLSRRDLVVGGR